MRDIVLVMMLLGIFVPLSVQAETFPTARVGVVDVGYIVREAKASQRANSYINAEIRTLEDEANKAEDILRQRRLALIEQEDSPERREQIRQYEAEASRLQLAFRSRRQELQAALERVRNDVSQRLKPILRTLVDELGINILVDRGRLIFANPDVDLTKMALERLNILVPEVDLVTDSKDKG